MGDCCGCCGVFKPRYKRLVDSIYPADANDGLVKSNMDKLTFFAMKSPEKLDRIGEYLAQRLSRDINRARYGFVRIAMEAMDTLLVTCHPPALNMFAESFLKMVQRLLECSDREMQRLATASFVKFSQIEEDAPSYHRRYDFFVSKFSAMCHDSDTDRRTSLRTSGLRGLQGVVRKTVSDDLQCNIWKPTHMDKIVPSLLFNMQQQQGRDPVVGGPDGDGENTHDEDNPAYLAETVFTDLVRCASFGHLNSVVQPVLQHLDNHNAWVPDDFAVKCFRVIMYSAQSQYGYIVVQKLMNHLDQHTKKDAKVRISIVDVLSETVLISAGGSIGPSVLEVFNTLLRHLRLSVDTASPAIKDTRSSSTKQGSTSAADEMKFQEAIVNTIGEFANNLPDYQKIEIMMFVMGKVPLPSDDSSDHSPNKTATDSTSAEVVHLQMMLLMALLKVANKYKTVLLSNAFPSAFLEPLLRMSLSPDPGVRRIVQEIFHNLLDRHGNLEKLRRLEISADVVSRLDLTVEPPPRQDLVFMKKYGAQIFSHLYENAQKNNNKVDNYERLYTTMGLLCVELGAGDGDEILLDELRLALTIQAMAIASRLPITHRCAIHALVATLVNLVSQLLSVSLVTDHVNTVISARRQGAPCYLPDVAFCRSNTSSVYPESSAMNPEWLFNAEVIGSALGGDHGDLSRLAVPFMTRPLSLHFNEMSKSASDIQSLILDVDSATSTPGATRRTMTLADDDMNFESMKRTLEDDPRVKEEDRKKQQDIYELFRTGQFEDIVARAEAKANMYQGQLDAILSLRPERPQEQQASALATSDGEDQESCSSSRGGRQGESEYRAVPVHEMHFPDAFVY